MDGSNRRSTRRQYSYPFVNGVEIKDILRMYNAITRAIEPELVKCARKFGIRLVVYNPLA